MSGLEPLRPDVRVLLCGDSGVGKSSLVLSLIKEAFTQVARHSVLPEVTIPPEITPEHVTTYIVDSSPRLEGRQHLENEMRKAHVVAIVYAIDDPSSFDRIPTFWLPLMRSLGVNVPVILVGNKIDLRGGEVGNAALEEEIHPIMTEFKEVETCIECSAKIPLNVSEVFYFAQKAVLHPTAPLYDTREHLMKPACEAALRRIFKICDVNKDGFLDDIELNDFQRKCFNAPLQQHELEGIKDVVREHDESMVASGGLTETGFLYLHQKFIQRGRLETTWTVLRKFGYGQDLTLREAFLHPKLDVPGDCTVELSPRGYQFFTEIFEAFDKDQDGALNQQELDALFSTSPGNPWLGQAFPQTTVTARNQAVTLQGWLAQWSMTTLLEHRTTLAYLAYLGYNATAANSTGPATIDALHVSRPRRTERKTGKVERNVFLCYVLGAAGSGKTTILKGLVGKPFSSRYEPTSKLASVVNSVEIKGAEKYLVFQEFGSNYESEVLRNSKKLNLADVLLFVYDSADTNSFSYLSNLRQQYKLDHLPSIFVATKSDQDLAQQRHEVQPDVYCKKLSLPVPVAVSIKTQQTADLYHIICNTAMHPSTAIPGGADRPLRVGMYLSLSALVGTLSAAAFFFYRTTGSRTLGSSSTSWLGWIGLGRREL